MNGLRIFFTRLRSLFGKRRLDADLDIELRSHLDALTEDNIRHGMSPDDARHSARRAFGGIEQTKEAYRDRRGLPFLETLAQDVRFGARMLIKNPGFTLVAILTLALGIGANTAIFSVADTFLLHPIPLPGLDRLAVVAVGQKAPAAVADFFDWRAQAQSFQGLAAFRSRDINVTGKGEPERVYGAEVTADFFSSAGVLPALGRGFVAGEDQFGRDPVAILGHGLWQRRFAANPAMLGESIEIDGQKSTIVGIMDREFDFPVPTDVWIPLALTQREIADRAGMSLHVFGALKPGISIGRAQAEMTAIESRLAAAYPATNKDRVLRVMPLAEFVQGSLTRAYTTLLLCVVGIVLLVACANVANLQFARATSRRSEIALRAALGASRWRIARQLLTESLLLSVLGAAASLAFAKLCLGLLVSNMPAYVVRLWAGFSHIRLDGRSFVFTFVAAVVSGILAGVLPAMETSRLDAGDALKESGRGTTAGRRVQRLRNIFVVAQVAVALVLLAGAGLLVKGFHQMAGSADAFAPEQVLTLAVDLPASRYAEPADRLAFYRKALDALASLPGARSAAAFSCYPLSNNGTSWEFFQVEGRVAPDQRHSPWADAQSVSPEYFRLMRVPIVAGRVLAEADREDSQPVAIVNQKLARLQWPGESAVGKRIRMGAPDSSGPWLTVVGVAADVLYDWTSRVPQSTIYLPLPQAPNAVSLLAIRTDVDPASYVQATRARIAAIDPNLPAFDVKTLALAIHESTVGLGYTDGMMAVLGLIALAVAVVGVYGVMANSVGERTHEFGVRMALGAQPRDVLWLASRRGLLIAAAGFAIGVPAAIACARLLAALVYGASPSDPATFIGVPLLLGFAVSVACYIPARRAMRVDPLVALRYE